jgi:tRNA (guanine10-N2)-dimethyltransferase
MRIAFELSGEHPTLPRADALAALEAEGVAIRSVSLGPQLLVVDAVRPPKRALQRVALSRYVLKVVEIGGLAEVLHAAKGIDVHGESFRVRAHGVSAPEEKRDLERRVGAAIEGRADLEGPDREFRLLPHGGGLLLGEVVHEVERSAFEARKVSNRPFTQPISLHPKYARALVNLSRCPTGGALLDPFCGTGGIAIEGARLGMRVTASDLSERMVRGTASTLEHYGLDATTFRADIGDVPRRVRAVDAIATDPPYGRSTTTRGEPVDALYRRAFSVFRKLLRRGGFAAVVLPSDGAVRIGEESLELVEAHPLRVHATLTRTFCAFVSPP